MEKPVIILGGGIVGSLLAYRLKEILPQVAFKIYEGTSTLGEHTTSSFRESDCSTSMSWLRTLISHSWKSHLIKFRKTEREINNPYHLIDSRHLHEVVSNKLGHEILRLNNKIPLVCALQEASFVIDTRSECRYKKTGYRKHLTLEMELLEDHHLVAPVIFDEDVDKKDFSRCLSYFPLSEKKILIKDFWFSDNKKLDLNEMRNSLNLTVKEKGWKISRIMREESGVCEMPITSPLLHQEGRVISLAGLFHDTTGNSIGAIAKLVDQMVQTSFRLGELREVVTHFRKQEENDRKFFRYLNKRLIEEKRDDLLVKIYDQSPALIERFSRGKLNFMDRSRITWGSLLPAQSQALTRVSRI